MIFQDLKFIKALNKFSWFYLWAINLNWFTSILLAFNDCRGHSSLISQNGVPALKLVEIAIVPVSGGVTRCVNLGAKLLVVVRMKEVDWLQPKCQHWSGIDNPIPRAFVTLVQIQKALEQSKPRTRRLWFQSNNCMCRNSLVSSYQTALRNGSM